MSSQNKYNLTLACNKRGTMRGFVHANSEAEARAKATRLYNGWDVLSVEQEPDTPPPKTTQQILNGLGLNKKHFNEYGPSK